MNFSWRFTSTCFSEQHGQVRIPVARPVKGENRFAAPSNDGGFARVLHAGLLEADNQQLSKVVFIEPTGIRIAVGIRDQIVGASKRS